MTSVLAARECRYIGTVPRLGPGSPECHAHSAGSRQTWCRPSSGQDAAPERRTLGSGRAVRAMHGTHRPSRQQRSRLAGCIGGGRAAGDRLAQCADDFLNIIRAPVALEIRHRDLLGRFDLRSQFLDGGIGHFSGFLSVRYGQDTVTMAQCQLSIDAAVESPMDQAKRDHKNALARARYAINPHARREGNRRSFIKTRPTPFAASSASTATTMLGMAKDRPEIFERAIAYLKGSF